MKLYYDSIEQDKKMWPDCTVSAIIDDDMSYVKYVDNILSKSTKTLIDNKGRIVCQLVFAWGWTLFRFTKQDGQWLDLCEYQLYNNNDKATTELWTLGKSEEVWNKIVNIDPKFIELQAVCKSKGGKLTKPKELKGVNSIGSVKWCKASCAVFVVGDDIYIRHNDYFSPIWTPPDPEYRFAPLGVVIQHYFGKEKVKKFIMMIVLVVLFCKMSHG